jgi:hypothetical protein
MIILERVQSVEKDGKRVYFVGRMFVFFIYIYIYIYRLITILKEKR